MSTHQDPKTSGATLLVHVVQSNNPKKGETPKHHDQLSQTHAFQVSRKPWIWSTAEEVVGTPSLTSNV